MLGCAPGAAGAQSIRLGGPVTLSRALAHRPLQRGAQLESGRRAPLGGSRNFARRRRLGRTGRPRVMPRRKVGLRSTFGVFILARKLGKQRKCHCSETHLHAERLRAIIARSLGRNKERREPAASPPVPPRAKRSGDRARRVTQSGRRVTRDAATCVQGDRGAGPHARSRGARSRKPRRAELIPATPYAACIPREKRCLGRLGARKILCGEFPVEQFVDHRGDVIGALF